MARDQSTADPHPADALERAATVGLWLHHLLGFRAALAPFQATLQALGERVQEPDGRRQLLVLWRPCQEQLDLLLDGAHPSMEWPARMGLFRREMEDHLLDELYSPVALRELVEDINQMCEVLLLRLAQELTEVTAKERGR